MKKTTPWAPQELLSLGTYKLYYEADQHGRILHVYLPGGIVRDLPSLLELPLKLTFPEVVRLP